MKISLDRIVLYVQNVDLLKDFYVSLGLEVIETIPTEWAVLKAGHGEIALHQVGVAYRSTAPVKNESNAKLVFTIDKDVALLRSELISRGVEMREVKTFPGFPYTLCDGVDPEGNVFQFSKPL